MFSIDSLHYANSVNYLYNKKGAFKKTPFKTDTIKQNYLLLYDC